MKEKYADCGLFLKDKTMLIIWGVSSSLLSWEFLLSSSWSSCSSSQPPSSQAYFSPLQYPNPQAIPQPLQPASLLLFCTLFLVVSKQLPFLLTSRTDYISSWLTYCSFLTSTTITIIHFFVIKRRFSWNIIIGNLDFCIRLHWVRDWLLLFSCENDLVDLLLDFILREKFLHYHPFLIVTEFFTTDISYFLALASILYLLYCDLE